MNIYKTLSLAGVGGLGASGLGGYFLLRNQENEIPYIKAGDTFKNRYSQAILEEGSELWESKFNALRQGAEPTHPTLIKAKAQVTPKEQDAKDLHKQGCQEIYESELQNSPHFQDFKTYCARNLKDGMGSSKSWITEDKSGTKWNAKLTSLKSHDEGSNQALDSTLKNLKDSLPESNSSWDDNKREELKNWCDDAQKEIFMGEGDPWFVHAGLYCVE
ncbi:hypothetical protein MHF_0864 [Mycoplasma haemofelis Ohio2]|uniref:Uncharacterized protein n=1 Tax=Mycoplasma haemofelis (strain Ohio2) TaxID=859194 RepID=F6FIT0_MYCHI|nr:hypothetical protein MHF_0864 [Mycoplasma haemofelis Ohio2]